MILSIIDVLYVLLVSYLILKFRNSKIISFIGTAGTAYLTGICYSLLMLVLSKTGVIALRDTTALEILGYLGIALGIPLLLFSSNVKYISKVSKKVIFSFILLIISAVSVCIVAYILYAKKITDGDILSGMAVGLYTGGTPNLDAIASSFQLSQDTILSANLSDTLFGGIFYVFLIFLAKPFTEKLLIKGSPEQVFPDIDLTNEDSIGSFHLSNKGVLCNFTIALIMLVFSAGIGALIFVFKGKVEGTLIDCLLPAMLIGTTILGLLGSFVTKVSDVKENSTMGQFFTVVFSCAISSLLNFSNLSIVSLQIFVLYASITTSVFLVHMLLCRIFNIDSNTMIITSTSGIYGPAFVPGVAKAINAEYLLSGGLITGSLGYAVGTFLGIGTVLLLRIL